MSTTKTAKKTTSKKTAKKPAVKAVAVKTDALAVVPTTTPAVAKICRTKPHLMRLRSGTQPVGHVAFFFEKENLVNVAVTTLSPNDRWSNAIGAKIALGRLNLGSFTRVKVKPTDTLEIVRETILNKLLTHSEGAVRKAARLMLADMHGTTIEKQVVQYLANSSQKKRVRKLEFLRDLLAKLS